MMKIIRHEWNLFLVALCFFTRIPLSRYVDYSAENLNQSNRYFAAVGAVVGLIAGLVYWLAYVFFPHLIAIILSIVASVLLTGAFHEDGMADICDGFGGGQNKEQKLAIMKDSRLGTYGSLGLFLTLTLKIVSLYYLIGYAGGYGFYLVYIIFCAHILSRALAASFIYNYSYVSQDDSKAKPLAFKQTKADLYILLGSSLIFTIFLGTQLIYLIVFLLIIRTLLGRFYKWQIGGYTGDCLGAAQQISEVCIYLFFYAMFKIPLLFLVF
ncbi:MAG: adenosylcobinamide-GDP ribazoletransferase [Alphaproteobacteria bacterium]